MNPWSQSLCAVLLTAASAGLALRWRRGWWLLLGLGLAAVLASLVFPHYISRRLQGFSASVALPWIGLPLLRFKITRLTRFGLIFVTAGATIKVGWMEFLSPAFARAELATLQTHLSKGLCFQTTGYTCGPAAAVTALRRLGFPAEEGELGLLACSSQQTGTDPADLARAIRERFGATGARAEQAPLETLDDLRNAELALTVIKWDESVDHWVTVLDMTDYEVRYADPVRGVRIEKRAKFQEIWEHETIRVWRE